MPKPCIQPGCSRPARGRGLCLSHYSTRWKVGDLPPKERKELYVCQKVYLTKAQTLIVKQLANKQEKPTSEFLRSVIAKFLQHFDAE